MPKRREKKMLNKRKSIFKIWKLLTILILLVFQISFIKAEDWPGVYTGEFSPSNNEVYAIATDNSGNVYVTGMCDTDPDHCHGTNISTVKYSSSGVQRWVSKRYG